MVSEKKGKIALVLWKKFNFSTKNTPQLHYHLWFPLIDHPCVEYCNFSREFVSICLWKATRIVQFVFPSLTRGKLDFEGFWYLSVRKCLVRYKEVPHIASYKISLLFYQVNVVLFYMAAKFVLVIKNSHGIKRLYGSPPTFHLSRAIITLSQ